MFYFVAFNWEKNEPTGMRTGFGNCVQQFDFHPLADPRRAGKEIAAATGHDTVIVINVQGYPGSEF